MKHRNAIGLRGADDGAEGGGVGFRPPLAAEPVGHLAKDHARPQMPLGDEIGGDGDRSTPRPPSFIASVSRRPGAGLTQCQLLGRKCGAEIGTVLPDQCQSGAPECLTRSTIARATTLVGNQGRRAIGTEGRT
jgi:hypothetical protein